MHRRWPLRMIPAATLAVVAMLAPQPALAAQGRADGPRARSFERSPSILPGVHPLPGSAGSDREGPVERSGAATALAPVSQFHFDAVPRIGPNWPADPSGGMGEHWFFTAGNTSYALFDLGGAPKVGPAPFDTLFDYPARTQVYDPKVVYDPYGQTFVLVYLAVNDGLRRSWIQLVTIPDTPDAEDVGTWCTRRINGDQVAGNGRQWADYPGLGFDADRVVVSTNQFDFGRFRFRYAQILSFPKAGLYDCDASALPDVFARSNTRNPDGTQAFTIQPATTAGGPTARQLFLSYERGRDTSALVVWALKERASGLTLRRAAIPVGRVAISPYGTQGGGGLKRSNTWWDPGDLRLINAFYDPERNRLYAAHTIYRDVKPDALRAGYGEAAIRWYEVVPKGRIKASSITRRGTVGRAETDAGWPVVATDGEGNIWITYSRASAPRHEFLSAWAAEIRPGSRRATVQLLAAGQARFEATPGPERWGDFNGIARDPTDPSRIVMVNQYAKSDGSPPTRDWQETVDVVVDGG